MFTAEQLYEILKHKDGTGIGRDGQVKNKAGAALYSLWEGYKNKSASELDLNEAAFSIALNTMMEKADRGIRNGLTRGGFKQYFDEYLKGDVSRFGTAYGNLPPEFREREPLKKTFDAITAALDPEKSAFEWELTALMERIIQENEAVKQLRAGTHYAQTGQEKLGRKQLDEMERLNARDLKDDLAMLLAMDNLWKKGDPEAAFDRAEREKEAERVRRSGEFQIAWTAVEQQAMSADGLAKVFSDINRPELQACVAPAAAAASVSQEAAREKYQRDFRDLAEDAVRVYKALSQMVDNTHPSFDDESATSEELADLRKTYEEHLKANIATLTAMDELRKKGDFVSATDPEKLEAAADRIMEGKAAELDNDISILTSRVGGRTDLEDLFGRSGKPELSKLMSVAKRSVAQQARQAAAPEKTEPEKAGSRQEQVKPQPGNGMEGPSAFSPIMRFQAKLADLKEAVRISRENAEAGLGDIPLYQLDVNQFRRDLRELFALRDLGKTDPVTPVSDEQVVEQEKRIMSEKMPDYKLYQAVLKIKDPTRLERLADAIKGGETTEEFKKNVKAAAGLKTREKQTGGPSIQ